VEQLRRAALRLFPATAEATIDHAWAGVLGVPRDWCASAGVDWVNGIAWAGGYVGHGVAGSNLGGRTLCDLILRRDTALTALAWVNGAARKWEPEPLRFLGVHGMYAAYRQADRNEVRRRTTSRIAKAADVISGR
jgi:glycine/D-amino acid oxidase-like deaminating enzyme